MIEAQTEYIFRRMQLEMARRSPRAAIAFIGATIALYIYHMNSSLFISTIRALAVGAFVINLLRIYFSKKLLKNETQINMKFIWLHRWTIYINALLFGLLVSFSLMDYDHTFFNCWVVVCGVTAASTASIVYDRTTIYAVMGLVGALPLIAFTYIIIKTGHGQYSSLIIMALYILFLLTVSFDFHGRTIQSLKKDIILKETRAALDEQRAKAEFSARLATLGEMAGGIAHEINTPLSAIQLHTQMLSEYLNENMEVKKDLEKRVSSIYSITERIAKIIKSLRIFARDAEKDPFSKTSIKKIIEDTTALCNEKFKSAQIDLEVIIGDENCNIMGQETQLCQVLLNLLNNAYDAAIIQERKWVRIEATSIDSIIEVHVIDSGFEISKNVQEKLFQPFFTTKEIGKGVGLGLSISKGIIDNHNGKLYYRRDSKNTCFVIQLPRYTENKNIAA